MEQRKASAYPELRSTEKHYAIRKRKEKGQPKDFFMNFVLSPPKSVSIAALLVDKAILDLHTAEILA